MVVVQNKGELASPVTPASAFDEEKFLVPYYVRAGAKKKSWIILQNVPIGIGITSVFQILFHIFSNDNLRRLLRFEPKKQHEIWRFTTYMLIHDDWAHLGLNVVMQCLFALFLEARQGRLRVLVLYFLAGISGVLGASCVHPDLVIGASAGVYALLISNVADIILNYELIKYKKHRLFCIGIIVLFDILYNIVHFCSKDEPLISWVAHIVGGCTGLLMGFVLFKTNTLNASRKLFNQLLFWISLLIYLALMISLFILVIQIKKCTPSSDIRVKYVYFC